MEDFIKKVWLRLKSWWGALLAAATGHIGELVWHKLGDFDLLQSILGWFGVSTDIIFSFLLGPEFSLMAACIGIFGMVFLEKPDFKTKHPASQVVGAAVFVTFASLIGGALAFEQLLNTPKFAEVTKFYLDSETNRTVSKSSIEKMANFLRSNPSILQQFNGYPAFYIASSSDNGSEEYAGKLIDAFNNLGIYAAYSGQGAQDPGQTGIIVLLFDLKHPSHEAILVMSLLNAASIPYTPELWADHLGWPSYPGFMLFVTRNRPVPN